MHQQLKRFALLGMAVLALSAMGACKSQGTWKRVQKEGKARIGIANEPPYGYMTVDGKVAGEAPAVARAVLSRMGIEEVEPVVVEFGSLIPGLKAGRFDLIAAGMYVKPKRCGQILFSEPSYKIGEGFLVKAGNPKALHSYGDVRESGDVRIGVVAGAVERDYARRAGIPDEQVVILPDNATGLSAVQSGRIDAYAGTYLTVARLADGADDVELAEPFSDALPDGEVLAGYGAFGFQKKDADFQSAFNEELATFLGTPEWKEAVEEHGFDENTLPDKTTAQLCAGGEA
jgi:polar amino acid transport system substrate-binding protein